MTEDELDYILSRKPNNMSMEYYINEIVYYSLDDNKWKSFVLHCYQKGIKCINEDYYLYVRDWDYDYSVPSEFESYLDSVDRVESELDPYGRSRKHRTRFGDI